jgi:segregation and condensation protein B
MEISTIIPHIEALIFASDKPLTSPEVTEYVNNALGFIEDRASMEQVEAAIEGIKEKYDSQFYAFELKQSGGGWQFLTKPEFHKTVALINGDKFIKKLSTAALETLAIIAYKQPITKSEIESIRGVNCDYAVQKLLEKDLVIISGRNEDAVGKPLIYSTSKSFMDYFGINSADELPKISEVLMEQFEKATAVTDILGGHPLEEEPELPMTNEFGQQEEIIKEETITEETVNTGVVVSEETIEEEILLPAKAEEEDDNTDENETLSTGDEELEITDNGQEEEDDNVNETETASSGDEELEITDNVQEDKKNDEEA